MNFGLWDSVLLINVSRNCICGSSGEGILHRWCELLVWGLVELENRSFGFRSVLLPCCLLDMRLPILTLSKWVKKRGLVVVWPFSFLVTGIPFFETPWHFCVFFSNDTLWVSQGNYKSWNNFFTLGKGWRPQAWLKWGPCLVLFHAGFYFGKVFRLRL